MTRLMEIRLGLRAVSCVAELRDDAAPETCAIVWDALPIAGPAYHAKYAMNEVYTMIPPIRGDAPGLENSTVEPAMGDVAYFYFPKGNLSRRMREDRSLEHLPGFVDLAVFYGPNNFLLSPAVGFVPANVFATIVEGMTGMAAAMHDVWRSGSVGERLWFSRLPGRG